MAISAAACLALPFWPTSAFAQSTSIWTGAAGDNLWATAGNWSAGVPSAADAIADLSQIDLSADRTLTLPDVTLNRLVVGDLTPGGGSWYLADPSLSFSLTLTGVSPTISVGDLGAGVLSLNSGAGALPLRATSGFAKEGPGRLDLSANNSLGGTVVVKAGTLGGANSAAFNTASAIELAGGNLVLGSGTFTFSPALQVSANAAITFGNNSKTLAGAISGPAGVVLSLNQSSGSSSTVSLAGSLSAYSGEIVFGARYYRLDTAYGNSYAASGANAIWTINSGTTGAGSGDGGLFFRNGTNATLTFAFGALKGTGVLRGGGGAGTGTIVYQVGALGLDTTFSGLLLDTTPGGTTFTKAGLNKVGAGSLTLSGNNTYTGVTTVSSGTLVVNGDQSASTGAITVDTGATLRGVGTLGGAATVHGTLAPGTASTTGILSSKGDLTLASDATLRLRVRASGRDGLALTNPSVGGATPRTLTFGGKLVLDVAADAPLGTSGLIDLGANVTIAGVFGAVDVVVGATTLPLTLSGVTWTGQTGGRAYSFDSAAGSLTLSAATAPSALEAWRLAQFGSSASAGNAADSADPDGDGLPNLLEYATGGDPLVPAASPLATSLDTGRLALTFPVRSDAKLTYAVEASDDLAAWTTIFNADGATLAAAGATRTVVDHVVLATQPRRFLRLVVTVSP